MACDVRHPSSLELVKDGVYGNFGSLAGVDLQSEGGGVLCEASGFKPGSRFRYRVCEQALPSVASLFLRPADALVILAGDFIAVKTALNILPLMRRWYAVYSIN